MNMDPLTAQTITGCVVLDLENIARVSQRTALTSAELPPSAGSGAGAAMPFVVNSENPLGDE